MTVETVALTPAQTARAYDLLCEAVDMELGIGRLLEAEDPAATAAAYPELQKALDDRLALVMNIMTNGEEDI